jgi:glutamyl-tRNA(Gln) amidotransferase subunit D
MMQEGEHITFSYQHKELSGILIQLKDDQATVKLSTGYNIIVPVEEITGIASTPLEKTHQEKHQVRQNTHLPHITILHTGGTIASKVDYQTGAVTNLFHPEELIQMFPDMLKLANIESSLLRNMASDDMRFAHYNIMARAVLEEIGKGAKGVIITHGTDTIQYTAAALSFALEGVNIPVCIVGSQRSSDRGSSDASTNLIGALRFMTDTRAPGIYVAMHEHSGDGAIAIIDGLHSRKNHSSRRDAFASVNAPQVARVAERVEILDPGRIEQWKARASQRPQVMPFKEDLKIGLWKAHTQAFADELLIYDHYDGLVLEGTGLGHIPMNETDEFTAEHTRIRKHVEALARRIPVAITSQTIYGRINLNVYRPQRLLKEMGVLGDGLDMPPEIAFIKLAWLISNHDTAQARELYQKDLRGEISPRSPLEDGHKDG